MGHNRAGDRRKQRLKRRRAQDSRLEAKRSVFDPGDARQRQALVDELHARLEREFPRDWNDRCQEVAARTGAALKQRGLRGYRVAAGRLEEITKTGIIVSFKGEYTGTGKSQFHTWIQSPSGKIIDCSVVPIRYGRSYIWQPYVMTRRLRYTKLGEVTYDVLNAVFRKYRPAVPVMKLSTGNSVTCTEHDCPIRFTRKFADGFITAWRLVPEPVRRILEQHWNDGLLISLKWGSHDWAKPGFGFATSAVDGKSMFCWSEVLQDIPESVLVTTIIHEMGHMAFIAIKEPSHAERRTRRPNT